ncbi:MAG: CBS domain-containing protein [Promethearchaeota archaeon]|nr:MAG: CBS domain-containing protein [Candidatus Lokiarchaeota archaeon]
MVSQNFRNKLLSGVQATTFNDMILLPGWTTIEPEEADVSTQITPQIKLNIPLVSSPMDTVTEDTMAIALARQGGIGFIHRNCDIQTQVNMVKRVKRAESYIMSDVVTITGDKTVADALEIMTEGDIHGLPVVNDALTVIGICTWRDVRFAENHLLVKDIMTKDVVTAPKNISPSEAKILLHKHRIEKLPVVDQNNKLIGLITMKDLILKGQFPNSSRNEEGTLLCGAAISPFDLERAKALNPYVDILITDVSHFHSVNCFQATKQLLKIIETPLIVGSIGTFEAAIDCITKLEGIAGLRAGIGSGSICSTAVVTRAGAPTLFATSSCADAVKETGANLPIIADGGMKNPGDVALALAVGASVCMLGNIFAGTKESPGRLVALEGRYYKQYYGMGSEAAKQKRYALDRYSQPSKIIAEGVEGWVPYRGPLIETLQEFIGGLKASMGYSGARNIPELWEKARLAFITPAGSRELQPHDIFLPGGAQPKN